MWIWSNWTPRRTPLRILDFGFVPRRFAAEIGGRLVRRWRIRHGQYERLLPGRLELPAQLPQSEQDGRLLLRTGSAGRVDHGGQVRVHQFRVARRQSENSCNDNNRLRVIFKFFFYGSYT
jgi:hypothetical protein